MASRTLTRESTRDMRIFSKQFFVCALAFCCLVPFAHSQQYQWTVLAGQPGSPGLLDGAGPGAQFDKMDGIAVDAAGNVYVVDTCLRKINPAGVVTSFPTSGKNPDGTAFPRIAATRLTLMARVIFT